MSLPLVRTGSFQSAHGAIQHAANASRIIWNNVLGRVKEQLIRPRVARCWRRWQTLVSSCEKYYKSSYFMRFASHQRKPRQSRTSGSRGILFLQFRVRVRVAPLSSTFVAQGNCLLQRFACTNDPGSRFVMCSPLQSKRKVHVLIDSIRNSSTLKAPGRRFSSPWQQ